MPIETITTIPNWTSLEGRLLDGGYEIGRCLLSAPAAASFEVRVLGDRFTNAIVNVFVNHLTSSDQFALWEEALQLRSPELSSPLAVSKMDWEGAAYPYVILCKADERLSGVLRERILSVDEARELLRIAVDGLGYLHARGFVHSYLSPEEVLAIGDSIQLSTTSMRRINSTEGEGEPAIYAAPESAPDNITAAADIWCLGATLCETLTQKRCVGDCREQAESLPTPFNIIAYRCLDPDPQTRCDLNDLRAMLRGEQLHPIVKKPVVPEEVLVEPEPAPASLAIEEAPLEEVVAEVPVEPPAPPPPAAAAATPTLTPKPEASAAATASNGTNGTTPARPRPPLSSTLGGSSFASGAAGASGPRSVESPRPRLAPRSKPVYTEQRLRHPLLLEEEPKESRLGKFWIYTALVLLVVGLVSWFVWPRTPKARPAEEISAADAAPNSAGPQRKTNSTVPGSQSHVLGPDAAPGASPAQSATPPKAAATGTQNAHGDVWRVVVYTFAKREDAEKQAHLVDLKHHGLSPEVFQSTGQSPYLVVVGGNLTHDAALKIRQRARSSGLPRDTYVQNFDH